MAISPFGPTPLAKTASASCESRSTPEFTVTVGPVQQDRDVRGQFLEQPSTWGAAADGAFVGGMMAHAALNIDPQVLDAIEFSTSDHLHSLATIDNYVQAHFFAAPIESADGWFERLSGYVAEQKAAVYFESMGHHVEFAPVANQPVWDMLVDGHPVQIKEGLSGVKEFIVQHPGVDVFAPPDVAAAVKDPAVHALDVLDKDAIHAATHNALEGVHGSITPEFHFPLITLGFSSWREAKLLWNDKTTLDRALKHVGVDVAAVGAGGLAGAKLGALIGSVFPGPGTVIGAAAGGIGGAILAKFGANIYRLAPFKEALEEYNRSIEKAQHHVNWQIDNSKDRVALLQTEYQQKYLAARTDIERAAKLQISIVSQAFDNDLLLFCNQFPRFLEDLITQLERELNEVLSRVPSRGLWGLLFPSESDLYRTVVRAWFKRAQGLAEDEIKVFNAIESRTVDNLYTEVQHFLKEYSFELKSMGDELARVAAHHELAHREAEKIKDSAVKQAENKRSSLIEEFGKQVTELQRKIVDEIEHWNAIIKSKRATLQTESAAVGRDI